MTAPASTRDIINLSCGARLNVDATRQSSSEIDFDDLTKIFSVATFDLVEEFSIHMRFRFDYHKIHETLPEALIYINVCTRR